MDISYSGISIAVKKTALIEAKIILFSENIFETRRDCERYGLKKIRYSE